VAISSIIPERVLRFLNALPLSSDPVEWIGVFRDELCLLLGDVDRITVNVNVGCDLRNPQNYKPGVAITKRNSADIEESGVIVTSHFQEGSQAERLIEEFRRSGYPLENYHPPHGFDYYFGGQAYLGTIFLWRELAHEPISQETLETVGSLHPFLMFTLSYIVARRQLAEPDVRIFVDALRGLTTTSGLSTQEQRVVMMQMFGHSYKEMADLLGITVDGVKHHLKMIHRKTGARSYTELFAKYFMPRLDMKGPSEGPEAPSAESEGAPPEIDTPMLDSGVDAYYTSERTLGERARRFGEIAFGSVEEFAKALKIAPSNLQKYLSGERNPGLGMLQRLYELGCNINSLIGGDGSLFADNDTGRLLRGKFGMTVAVEPARAVYDATGDKD
jgi:DNA-binding CsgD family transcriptional regulator